MTESRRLIKAVPIAAAAALILVGAAVLTVNPAAQVLVLT